MLSIETAPPLRLSAILPTLNEAENIGPLIEELYRHIPELDEVIVVDDNSPDGTADIVEALARQTPHRQIRVEKRTTDPGLTNSLRHGISCARGEYVVWMDCDFSMPPEIIPKLMSCILHGYDIAVGSRFVRGGSFKQNTEGTPDSALAVFLSRIMNYSIQLLLDHSFKDYTSGFIVARREILKAIPLRGNYGEYFIDFIFRALRHGYLIIEVPYVCLPRRHGVSKTGQNLFQYLRLGSRYIHTALRLRWDFLSTHRVDKVPPGRPMSPSGPKASDVSTQALTADYVPLVAGLHHQVLYQTLNSRLGIPFLEDLYGSLLLESKARCWVLLHQNTVSGFVTATLDLMRTQSHIMRMVTWNDRVIALLHILTSLKDLRDYLAHQRLCFFARRLAKPYPSILTLGVAPALQGTGAADRLLAEAHAFFSVSGIGEYFVDVLADNHRGLDFYQKHAFIKVGECAGNVVLKRHIAKLKI